MADEGIRLNKYFSDAGLCSSREADKLISDGLVTVDGRRGSLGDRVLLGMNVSVSGEKIRKKSKHIYIVLYKPLGIVCTTDKSEPMNVVDFVDHDRRIYPIGRLDKDSEGLLLMTSDGDIVNKILRAAGKHEKEYQVRVDKPITPEFLEAMRSGVKILGVTTLPCTVEKTGERNFTIILTQGLNRQIRSMCEALGYSDRALKRVRIMNMRLGNLSVGQWRNLVPTEMAELRRELNIGED